MKRLSLFGVLLCAVSVFFSCNVGAPGSVQEDTKEEKGPAFEWVGEYQSEEDSVLQVLKVRLLSDELFFDYAVAAGDDGACYSLSGRAILKVGDLEWDDDDEWNLRTDNWDAVYVPVRQSFSDDGDEGLASWIKGEWKELSSNPASDLPDYSPDSMTSALPQMHNSGASTATLDWDGLRDGMYH